MPEMVSGQALDTFPRLLVEHARVRGGKPAMREKDLGIWQCWTWPDVAEEVHALASGLAEMGLRRGDNLAIVGDNRPRMYMMMTAVQCLGGVPVLLYQDAVASEIAAGAADDVSVMLYTSGTTGQPKGVRLTHAAFISAARGGAAFDRLSADDDILSYLPMAWVGDHLFSFAQAMLTGFTINCPESAETVMDDLREIGPTYYFAPPRVCSTPMAT